MSEGGLKPEVCFKDQKSEILENVHLWTLSVVQDWIKINSCIFLHNTIGDSRKNYLCTKLQNTKKYNNKYTDSLIYYVLLYLFV